PVLRHRRRLLFPYTTLFRSVDESFIPAIGSVGVGGGNIATGNFSGNFAVTPGADGQLGTTAYSLSLNGGVSSLATTLVDSKTNTDRKSTRLNSSHRTTTYAV